MVKVFKTTVTNCTVAEKILDTIRHIVPDSEPSFDLEDCDNVLCVEYSNRRDIDPDIKYVVNQYGYEIEHLN